MASNLRHTSSEVASLVAALLSGPRIPFSHLGTRQDSYMFSTLQPLTR